MTVAMQQSSRDECEDPGECNPFEYEGNGYLCK